MERRLEGLIEPNECHPFGLALVAEVAEVNSYLYNRANQDFSQSLGLFSDSLSFEKKQFTGITSYA
jgi:hypothetical protein